MNRTKSVALFFAAPFIGLAYAVALPFVGLYMFINLGVERSLLEGKHVIEDIKTISLEG